MNTIIAKTSHKMIALGSVGDSVWREIVQEVGNALHKASKGELRLEKITFSLPPDLNFGDLSFPCFALAQKSNKNPAEVAKKLAAELPNLKFVEKFSTAGPYLNFHLNRPVVAKRVLQTLKKQRGRYGQSKFRKDEVIVLEYVSPNTNKPLHLGHVRNGLLGAVVANLMTEQGAKVVKTDIINDRGIHIAKSMLAYVRWGKGQTPVSSKEKGDHFVGRFYVLFEQKLAKERKSWLTNQNINLATLKDQEREKVEQKFLSSSKLMQEARAYLRDWESDNPEVKKLWKKMNAWVYQGFDETYRLLGFSFDRHYYESNLSSAGQKIVTQGVQRGIFRQEKDNAIIAPLQERFHLPDKVLLRSDGTSVYITQDLALAQQRSQDFQFTSFIYCIGSEQNLYMQQLFAILKLLEFSWSECLFHLSYGLVYLPEGKMKSREGKVVDADDLLEQLLTLAKQELQRRYPTLSDKERDQRASAISLAALKFHFLAVSRETSMTFDPKASLSFEGKTGPYLQYTYARAASILRKADKASRVPTAIQVETDEEWQLILGVLDFPRMVSESAAALDPSRLANFLIDQAQLFSTFYHQHPVLKAPEPVQASRIALVGAVQEVLGRGLELLGIEPLEEM